MTLPPYYQDLKTLHKGTLPPHAYLIPYGSREAAAADDRLRSDRLTLLNGTWDFRFFESVRDLPDSLPDVDFTDTIPVPSVWQRHGYDRQQYTNVRFPFPYDPPFVPVDDPCGLYRLRFRHPRREDGSRLLLTFEGVDSCLYLWVNGAFAGYSQVSHSPSEFDITDFVPGEEIDLRVLVLKWCDGSYFEDQDKFRTSGIFRDVYLLDRPAARLEDCFVHTRIAPDRSRATLTADVRSGAPVTAYLLDPDGNEICSGSPEKGLTVDRPRLWNAEDPVLYTLLLECAGEWFCEPVGFRSVEIRDRTVLVNGSPVKFRGVNRHDSEPDEGPAVTQAQMLEDLYRMKSHNVNAIRTSHYPNSPLFTRLCDRLGFYVIAEADLECHGVIFAADQNDPEGNYNLMARDPAFAESMLDRVQRSVIRDQNRPCVLIWSMGNEAGYGENFEKAIVWTKRYDPSRLTHYERASFPPEGCAVPPELDLYSRMYPRLDEIDAYCSDPANGRPMILCEFIHAMGNGPGDAEDYFEKIERYRNFCGGFVWEWKDHAGLKGLTPGGKPVYGYGGDFGEFPHDGNFCVDGLCYPDRRPHTGLLEYKNVIRPVRVSAVDFDAGLFRAHSYLDFIRPSARYGLTCTVLREGVEAERLPLPADVLDIGPHGEKVFRVAYPDSLRGASFSLLFRLCLREDTPWAKAGSVQGFDQAGTPVLTLPAPAPSAACPRVSREKGRITVSGENFRYVYDPDRVSFTSLVFGQRSFTGRPVCLNVMRAPTDNDQYIAAEWARYGYDRAIPRGYEPAVARTDGAVVITAPFSVGAVAVGNILRGTAVWTIDGSGTVRASFDAETPAWAPPLPRFGLRFFLPEALDDVTYFGYGPNESYVDKHRSSWKALFRAKAADLHEDYLRPQENGSHWNCDLLRVSGGGASVTFTGSGFCFNASPYTQEALQAARHNVELDPSGFTVVCLDAAQNGIGSNSCGPKLQEKYALRGPIRWEFTMSFRTDEG